MPAGDRSACTGKQKRQAEHIEESYEQRGMPKPEAIRRAGASENKISGSGSGSGSGKNSGSGESIRKSDPDGQDQRATAATSPTIRAARSTMQVKRSGTGPEA